MRSGLKNDAAGALRVRPAAAGDADFVIELAERFGPARAAWRSAAEVVDGTRRQLRAAFDERRPGDAVFVATDAGGERLGFAYVVTHHDFFTGEAHGHVSEIATAADGRGAGSALMEAAEAWSRERGFRYLSLNVNDANDRARRFYEQRTYIAEYRHLVKLL
jgi:ribosomal protein S18 acetylase RimI-like enzyme